MLSPTLWRTCRVLSGKTRLALLRRVVNDPGLTVSNLADSLAISLPRASQELRRLQSRGLVRAVREGPFVRYQPLPDPQVPTAKPLLTALVRTFRKYSLAADLHSIRIASGYSQPRRIKMVRELLRGSRDLNTLCYNTGIPRTSLMRHLLILWSCGLVVRRGKQYLFVADPHPLARCLVRIVRQRS